MKGASGALIVERVNCARCMICIYWLRVLSIKSRFAHRSLDLMQFAEEKAAEDSFDIFVANFKPHSLLCLLYSVCM